jgi:hypothetical protein
MKRSAEVADINRKLARLSIKTVSHKNLNNRKIPSYHPPATNQPDSDQEHF